jgi:hypothetical protein
MNILAGEKRVLKFIQSERMTARVLQDGQGLVKGQICEVVDLVGFNHAQGVVVLNDKGLAVTLTPEEYLTVA